MYDAVFTKEQTNMLQDIFIRNIQGNKEAQKDERKYNQCKEIFEWDKMLKGLLLDYPTLLV